MHGAKRASASGPGRLVRALSIERLYRHWTPLRGYSQPGWCSPRHVPGHLVEPFIHVGYRGGTTSAGIDMTDPDPPAEPTAVQTSLALSAERSSADAADLAGGLADLAGLVTATLGLDDVLGKVATIPARAIPGADGAGVTLLRLDRTGHVEALAASDPFVTAIDQIQYGILNEGPCITAARERRTVRSGSLGGETMWPRFGPRVARMGIHSALSLPLLLPDQVVGAINVYARGKHVFDDHAVELGELFAAPAAVAVHNAQILTQTRTLTTQLQTALSSRAIIDQAIGLIRGRSGGTAEDALARLREISQHDHTKLADVAQHMVDEAVRRAQAGHTQP